MKTPVLIILFIATSTVRCQFFYNYEEDKPEESPADYQEYDPSLYQYNPPSTVNRQFLQERRQDSNPPPQVTVRRSQKRSQPEPEYYRGDEPQSQPEYVHDSNPLLEEPVQRQPRRQSRRRQRQAHRSYVQPTQPPRVYSPSVFQNIGLGEAPSGVYVPEDSLLNVLRNPTRRYEAPAQVYNTPAPVAYSDQNYVQPSVNYVNNQQQQTYFVQPPSDEEDVRKRDVILPVVRPQTQNIVLPPSAQNINRNQEAQTPSRQRRQRYRARHVQDIQPVIDIDSYRQYADDISREEISVPPQDFRQQTVEPRNNPQEQYTRVQQRRPSQNRRSRLIDNYQQPTQTPRIYSPSVFENVGLGEAPSGVYVPEDSLLNILRNPAARPARSGEITEELQEQFYALQSEANAERQQNSPVSLTSDEYSPRSSAKRSGHMSRQAHSSQRTEHQMQEYNDGYEEPEPVQAVQTSSQRRTNRDNKPRRQESNAVQDKRIAEPRRRQQTRTEPAAQSQAPSTRGQQSSFKPAKLAIAALPEDTDGDGIPGESGTDYPTLHDIPQTTFSCSRQPYNGYYADLETSCQVVHLCQSGGVQDSFLCPNGTIFSQEKFSCQWWYKVNCADAPRFYAINDNLYKVPVKEKKRE